MGGREGKGIDGLRRQRRLARGLRPAHPDAILEVVCGVPLDFRHLVETEFPNILLLLRLR